MEGVEIVDQLHIEMRILFDLYLAKNAAADVFKRRVGIFLVDVGILGILLILLLKTGKLFGLFLQNIHQGSGSVVSCFGVFVVQGLDQRLHVV